MIHELKCGSCNTWRNAFVEKTCCTWGWDNEYRQRHEMNEPPIDETGHKGDTRHWDLVDEIDELGVGLTTWEVNLIEDLLVKSADGLFPLSQAQKTKIEQIAEERLG